MAIQKILEGEWDSKWRIYAHIAHVTCSFKRKVTSSFKVLNPTLIYAALCSVNQVIGGVIWWVTRNLPAETIHPRPFNNRHSAWLIMPSWELALVTELSARKLKGANKQSSDLGSQAVRCWPFSKLICWIILSCLHGMGKYGRGGGNIDELVGWTRWLEHGCVGVSCPDDVFM